MSFLKDVVADGYAKMNKQNSEQQRIVQEQNLANQMQAREAKKDLVEANKELKKELEFYKALLARPMAEIAAVNDSFKDTYEKQQELLGNWMVSQKAFKETAIKLGVQLGKTSEEIIAEGMATKAKVLDGETEYGNNFIDDEKDDWAIYYAPRIKERFLK